MRRPDPFNYGRRFAHGVEHKSMLRSEIVRARMCYENAVGAKDRLHWKRAVEALEMRLEAAESASEEKAEVK